MSKILCCADVHIGDYTQRNPYAMARLNQDQKVADNLIEAGKTYGCDYIVFAGDIVEKAINRPYVQAEVKRFLDKVMSNFKYGWIIWGNHDQDNKGKTQSMDDCCLSVMLPSNLEYAHSKCYQIENTSVAFSNWQPEFDLSWISSKVDILITHATISYNDMDFYESQVLDESKFDLALCGDIHKPGEKGKYVSIGIPQRCKMSDGEEITGIVLDTMTKSWERINLNPNDNLIKFDYVTDKEKEGWDSSINTWHVYKQSSFSGTSSTKDVEIPAWEEIENLTISMIQAQGLEEIHSLVLHNIGMTEISEVNFDFTLTRMYCKNWRSIDEAEVFFNPNDKILLTGHNGSGKSSFLSAIKIGFIGQKSYKEFVMFDKDNEGCKTEVDFIYEGSNYRLIRGTSQKEKGKAVFGLYINDVEMKYNNKNDFDADIAKRFPFIQYMSDLNFYGSSHGSFINPKEPEKITKIISKFMKTDHIDVYNDTALRLYDETREKEKTWKTQITQIESSLSYLDSRLSMITIPDSDLKTLEDKRIECQDIQRRAMLWNRFITSSANIQAEINFYTQQIQELSQKILTLRLEEDINSDLAEKQNLISSLNQKVSKASSIQGKINSLKYDLDRLSAEGKRKVEELKNLDNVKVCPYCGQALTSPELIKQHKDEYQKEIDVLRNKYIEINNQMKSEETLYNSIKEEADKSQELINQINSEIALLLSEKQGRIDIVNKIESYKYRLVSKNEELQKLGQPEKVELPEGFSMQVMEIENDINVWNSYNQFMKDKLENEDKLSKCNKELEVINRALEMLQKYITLTGPTGKIYEEIVNRLAEQFSDNKVKYEVDTDPYRGKSRLVLRPYFNNNDHWVSYEACSDGQKTVLDVHYLSKIVTRTGLLVLDEFFKHLDPANHDNCLEIISGMNIGCTMISSHMESIAAFNNKSIQMQLNEKSITEITIN